MKRGGPAAGGANRAIDETLYTIGHSNHPIERFIDLLRRHAITATWRLYARKKTRSCATGPC
ncbi:MAG TPA: hypothetical protein VN604_10515 [Nitrospirota bacterium]|nr:hypothetical protein [Nitrospirota bacterium]